ncbi:MAG: DNA starvation/stationary phase protection protein [Bacteroidales bacterium]|nr:DNA starvation/stationary phase protection protein [Bacteroidales bacterium]MCF8339310.1 DNA starvation/stationary phase protection protein [Bacteroidales bacterium]
MEKNQVNLAEEKSQKLVDELNVLLGDVQVFYMNVKGYHWNIEGKPFFVLHDKFEELYNDLAEKGDEIAERIKTLEGRPVHSYSEFLNVADIKEETDVSSDEDTVKGVVNGLQKLVDRERNIINMASENGDETTADILTGFMGEQEKMIWMYNAFIK